MENNEIILKIDGKVKPKEIYLVDLYVNEKFVSDDVFCNVHKDLYISQAKKKYKNMKSIKVKIIKKVGSNSVN